MVYGSIYESSRLDGSFLPEYAGSDGPFRMVTESLETDQALFDIVIEHDFLEVAAGYDVQLESTLEAIDEGFLGDLWGKIVELLNKIKDKIVSIFKAATVKIGAYFTKDNKALMEKYQKQFNAAQHDKITIKGFRKKKESVSKTLNIDYLKGKFTSATTADSKEAAEKLAKEGTSDKCLADITGKASTTSSSFNKDLRDVCFDHERDVKAKDITGHISDTLSNYSTSVSSLNETKTKLVAGIEESKKSAEEKQKHVNETDYDINNANKDTADVNRKKKETEQAQANACRSIAQAEQTACAKAFSGFLDLFKFDMKQCRKAYITIATKGAPSVTKEDAELADEEIGLVDYEVDSFFEQDSYDEDELTA